MLQDPLPPVTEAAGLRTPAQLAESWPATYRPSPGRSLSEHGQTGNAQRPPVSPASTGHPCALWSSALCLPFVWIVPECRFQVPPRFLSPSDDLPAAEKGWWRLGAVGCFHFLP